MSEMRVTFGIATILAAPLMLASCARRPPYGGRRALHGTLGIREDMKSLATIEGPGRV
jgi:hypothetical protein